ncbi:hypothetical protein [Nostoc sp. CCY 9925]|uniref:hypothetical protein n=1 Tax=Nostoc sp. CCY 9925 TaxID=3103865 RepID=UPI0039C62A60
MTIARQNTAASFHDSKSINISIFLNFVRLATKEVKVFYWYIHAYWTILSVMLLTLTSLIYLIIHRSLSKLLRVLMHRDEWKVSSTK